jgi:putative lipoprotein
MSLRGLAAAAACAALALACSSPSRAPREPARLTGTATYRERIALPAAARLEVQLVDATEGQETTPLVAERLIEAPGQVPIAFSLDYDPRAIDARRTYALRVRIRVGEDVWFANPFDVRVLTGGNPNQVEVLLDRVSAGGAPAPGGGGRAQDPDPPNVDPRVKAVRDEARAIDARLDRLDMREVVQGSELLQLWTEGDAPVKLVVTDTSRLRRSSSYYFRGGELFWARDATAGYEFENGALVLRTDAALTPLAELSGGGGVLNAVRSHLAQFGL